MPKKPHKFLDQAHFPLTKDVNLMWYRFNFLGRIKISEFIFSRRWLWTDVLCNVKTCISYW